jgi:uncharacterized protein
VFFGAAVKGAVGFGMPIVAVPLLTLIVDLPSAVMLMVIPILTSNIHQAAGSGNTAALLRRFWPVMLLLMLGVFAGVRALATFEPRLLNLIMGAAIVSVALLLLLQPSIRIRAGHERVLGPFAGLLSGFLGGVAALFGPPMVVYLVGLNLPKDEFVKAVATIYLCAALTLMLAMSTVGPMRPVDYAMSGLAAVPTHLGIGFGTLIRRHVPQHVFRMVVLSVVLVTGLDLVRKGVS